MNELLARAGGVFLAPAPAPATRAPAPSADLVGVLAPERDLAVVAGGIRADLRRRHRCRDVLMVTLGGDEGQEAVRDTRRAVLAAAGSPAVIALARRSEELDELLADADLLVLATPADAEPTYRELALSSLAALGPPTASLSVPEGLFARTLALHSLARLVPA